MPITPVDIDSRTTGRLARVLEAMRLKMAIVDLKIDATGEPVFLELNPQGQLLFVEGLTGLDLTGAFSEFLRAQAVSTRARLARAGTARNHSAAPPTIGAVAANAFRLLRAGGFAAALLCVSAGVAAADPLPVADVTQSADTDDGWHLSAALTRMTINSVPNMAATAFTREGFVTGKAAATIDGSGAAAVNSGTLVFGLQLGCQIDLSEGGSIGGDADIGVSPGFSGGDALSDVGPYADLGGNVSINLLPGTITNVGLGKKALKGRTGEIVVHDAHVKVDACGGAVSVRFFASAMIDTDKSDDSVNAYGDILSL